LADHLAAVARRAESFAGAFELGAAGTAAGRLHDIGKSSLAFQAYLCAAADTSLRMRGPDHSTAGAREAQRLYPGSLGQILAFLVAGHHAGLADGKTMPDRL